MSRSVILYLAGLAFTFVGLRLFDGAGAAGLGGLGLGVALLLASVGLRASARGSAGAPNQAEAHRRALLFTLAGVGALLVYGLSLDWTTTRLGLGEEAARRWSVVMQALWPIVLLIASVPLVLIDLAIEDTPMVQPVRIRQATQNGLIAALGFSLIFPVNYLATEHNKRWDLAYFKTTTAGESTRAIVDALESPVVVRVFLPTASDVAEEVMPYFKALEGPTLTVELLDHAAEPVLAKDLKIRDNGHIAVTLRDGAEDAVTKSWKVGADFDSAKRNLKKLDEEFRKRLLELVKGKETLYFTVGHEELNWKGGDLPEDKLGELRKLLQAMNFNPKELGLAEGLGTAVPDDAGAVFIIAPKQPLLEGEVAALKAYIDRGGAVFVALEPGGEPLTELLAYVGLQRGEGTLATSRVILRRTGDKLDRVNLVTNRYSSHESTTTLSRYNKQFPLVVSGATFFTEVPGGKGKVTTTIRTLEDTWADLEGDLEQSEAEKSEERILGAAVSGKVPAPEGGAEEPEFKVIALADATALSDLVLGNKGNQVLVIDGIAWLLGQEQLAGTVENEEDVKIEHTQEDQKTWFYGTIFGVPGVVLLLGWLRVRARRKGGAA